MQDQSFPGIRSESLRIELSRLKPVLEERFNRLDEFNAEVKALEALLRGWAVTFGSTEERAEHWIDSPAISVLSWEPELNRICYGTSHLPDDGLLSSDFDYKAYAASRKPLLECSVAIRTKVRQGGVFSLAGLVANLGAELEKCKAKERPVTDADFEEDDGHNAEPCDSINPALEAFKFIAYVYANQSRANGGYKDVDPAKLEPTLDFLANLLDFEREEETDVALSEFVDFWGYDYPQQIEDVTSLVSAMKHRYSDYIHSSFNNEG